MAKKAAKQPAKKAATKKTAAKTVSTTKKTETMGKIKPIGKAAKNKKVKKQLDYDYSTAVAAPDYMQNADKGVFVYYVDDPKNEGETILMSDLKHKLHPEAKKAMKIA